MLSILLSTHVMMVHFLQETYKLFGCLMRDKELTLGNQMWGNLIGLKSSSPQIFKSSNNCFSYKYMIVVKSLTSLVADKGLCCIPKSQPFPAISLHSSILQQFFMKCLSPLTAGE